MVHHWRVTRLWTHLGGGCACAGRQSRGHRPFRGRSFGPRREPGAYATDFGSQSSLKIAAGLDAYAGIRAELFAYGAQIEFGDPAATLPAVLKVIDAEHPPLRIFLGTEGMPVVRAAFAERLAQWEAWEATSNAAQGVSRKLALDFAG